MKDFGELNIKSRNEQFVGDKIKMNKVLNKKISVLDYKIKPSKFDGKCLHLQIEFENEKRIVFTRGSALIDVLEQSTKADFPFNAKIVREDENGPFEFRTAKDL